MKGEELELLRGSGNVFRDLGYENADVERLKALLAAADFSRLRNADLGRFTVDRLMTIINRLGSRVEVKIKLRRRQPVPA
jgi:predicted XRE-type DNA-binding protein